MLHDIRCPEPLPAEPTQPTRREVFNVWTSLSPFNATPMTWWTGVWNDDGGSSHRHQLLIISTSFHKIQHPLNAPLIPSPTESDSPIQKSTGPPIDPPCVVLRRSPRDAWSWRIRSHSRCPPHPSGLIQTSQVQHGPIEPPSKKNIIPTFRHPQQVTFLRIQVSTHHWIKDRPAKTSQLISGYAHTNWSEIESHPVPQFQYLHLPIVGGAFMTQTIKIW